MSSLSSLVAWTVLLAGFVLPLLHVLVSPRAGSWRPPPGSRCPIGPRPGWLVIVVMLGPVGWILFLLSRYRKSAASSSRGPDA